MQWVILEDSATPSAIRPPALTPLRWWRLA
jgi:hypothetical protein